MPVIIFCAKTTIPLRDQNLFFSARKQTMKKQSNWIYTKESIIYALSKFHQLYIIVLSKYE